jgi:hypothetical protein
MFFENRSSLQHSVKTLEDRNPFRRTAHIHIVQHTYILRMTESRSELGGSIVTMVQPADSLLSKDPT